MSNVNELISLNDYLYTLLGVKQDNRMTSTEEGVFNGVVLEQFKKWSIEEIKYAFRLAIAGNLNDEKLQIFNKLDTKVLGQVMKAYQKHKNSKIKHFKESQPSIEHSNALSEVQKKEIENTFTQECIFPYLNEFGELREPKISMEHFSIFKKLLNQKAFQVTVNDIAFYKTLAEKELEKRKKAKKFDQRIKKRSGVSTMDISSNDAQDLKMIAACLCMHDKLKELIEDGKDLLSLI